MSRLLLPSTALLGVGTSLLLSRLRWFSRAPLVERLRPYAPAAGPAPAGASLLSGESFAQVLGPLAQALGQRTARLLGVGEDLALRLERIHGPLDVTAFRIRQVGWSAGAFAAGTLVAIALQPPLLVVALLLVGTPLLAFLLLEQQVATASAKWQRRVFLELPVVVEQLATLLTAGYSLGAAMNRLSARGRGACAQDLARVCGRMRQGLTEAEALREWSHTVRVPAVDRLLPVLALSRDTTDLGRLLTEEARALRRDVQRELIEIVDRRAQQVWIPVTVATLVPGVIFLAIPFIEALRLFSGS